MGIHDHPYYKLGRRPPKNGPALMLADVLSGTAPVHPAAADHFGSLEFGLYGNDRFGDCGPVSVANLVRLVTAALTGAEVKPSQDDVFDLYRRSGNPAFDPNDPGGPGDRGVDMQVMLEALLEGGIGGIKPVAFAKVNVASDQELNTAVSIFGGVLWGVNLEVAQQQQTDLTPPKWDFAQSGEWGGHAIVDGKYDEATGDAEVISWARDVQTTPAFRANQLEEAWVVVWDWNVQHPAFQAGVDVAGLQAAYKSLTGRDLVLPAPAPVGPSEVPTAADEKLWRDVGRWVAAKHSGRTGLVAGAVSQWARRKGFYA